jgi:hypothetical protein
MLEAVVAGLIAMLLQREADLAMAVLVVEAQAEDIVDLLLALERLIQVAAVVAEQTGKVPEQGVPVL